jgi:hypothetical protein
MKIRSSVNAVNTLANGEREMAKAPNHYETFAITSEAAAKVRSFAYLLSIRKGKRVTNSESIMTAFELAEKYLETVK